MVTIRGRIMVGYLRKIGKDTGRAREIPAAGWREHTSNGEQRQSEVGAKESLRTVFLRVLRASA
jgi:hypothetical protein